MLNDSDPIDCVELAGAWLLGSDATVMVSAQTNSDLELLLHGPKRGKLIEDMARAIGRHDAMDYSRRQLE